MKRTARDKMKVMKTWRLMITFRSWLASTLGHSLSGSTVGLRFSGLGAQAPGPVKYNTLDLGC